MKVTSLKKNAKLFNYTKTVYTIIEKKQFPGLWKYKLDGYTDRWFPSPFLMNVDIQGMIPLGTEKHKGTINFNTTYDREAQIQSLHEGNRKQAVLTPEELDLQVLQIDKQKQKQALQENANLPDIPSLRRSNRTIKKIKASTAKKESMKIKVGQRFKHDDDKLIYRITAVGKNISGINYKQVSYDFNKPYVRKRIL